MTLDDEIIVSFADCPSEPTNVQLTVASSSSLLVTFADPLLNNGGVVTRYKGTVFVCCVMYLEDSCKAHLCLWILM